MSAVVDRVVMSPPVLCRRWTCCRGFRRISTELQDGMLPERRHNSTSIFMTKMSSHTLTPALLIKTHTDTHNVLPFQCLKSVSKYVPWNHCSVWREVAFFLYEFSPQPNLFKASLFSLLQQRCTSHNLILVKSKSFGPINYLPTLTLP